MAAHLRKLPDNAPAERDASGASTRVCVGAIAGAHGIKGEVKIKSFTAEPLSVGAYGPLWDETGARRFTLSGLRRAGSTAGEAMVIARLEGVTDRTAAEALRGLRLYAPRAALPATEPDEYYHHDLVGLVAVLPSGERLGKVAAVHNFGAGDLLEIARAKGAAVVVPFTNAAVPRVDLAAGKVVVDPPEGLLADDAPNDEAGEEAGKP